MKFNKYTLGFWIVLIIEIVVLNVLSLVAKNDGARIFNNMIWIFNIMYSTYMIKKWSDKTK